MILSLTFTCSFYLFGWFGCFFFLWRVSKQYNSGRQNLENVSSNILNNQIKIHKSLGCSEANRMAQHKEGFYLKRE